MVTTKERKPNRTPEQIVAELEAKIASVKARAARRSVRARPEIQLSIVARRALAKAHEAAEGPLKHALSEAVRITSAALDAAAASTPVAPTQPPPSAPPNRARRGRSTAAADGAA